MPRETFFFCFFFFAGVFTGVFAGCGAGCLPPRLVASYFPLVTLHQRYLYRGYLQIAALDLTRSNHPALWFITWDPTQPIATRPLSIRINGTWYTFGWDLTKNICELYSTGGGISTSYTYTPFGKVTSSGSITQPIQWSSEYKDDELSVVYYNWRYYCYLYTKWNSKDLISNQNMYIY